MPSTTSKGYPYPVGTDRVMDGDDSIKNLAEAVDTHLGRMATGQATTTISGAPTTTVVPITFPAGRFTAAPRVFTTITTGNPPASGSGTASSWATSVTTTGADLQMRNSANGSMSVQWLAVQV